MVLQESGEMYIESIFLLSKANGQVRSIDIAEHLGYSKPSVSRAIGLLKNGGYVESDENGFLKLTEKGLAVAKKTYERHTLLSNLFVKLGVSKKIADEDACKIEHVITDGAFKKITELVNRL